MSGYVKQKGTTETSFKIGKSGATLDASGVTNKTITLPDISGTLYLSGGTDVGLADGGTGASLADPGADRIMFWDDSAGAVTWLTVGTNLSITDTTINASGGGGVDLVSYTYAGGL